MPSSALRCEVPVLREMKLVPCERPAKLYVGGIVQTLCADHVKSLRLLGVILTRIDRRKRATGLDQKGMEGSGGTTA
jgi:hypothetical protein